MKPITRMRRARCGIVRLAATVLGAWAIVESAACASAAAPPPQTKTKVDFAPLPGARVESSSGGELSATGPLPALPTLAPADAAVARPYSPPINVNLNGQDIRTALTDLSTKMGLNLVVDPSVHGVVTVNDNGVSLTQALNDIVRPSGYAYALNGPTLVVGPVQYEHRNFTFDYVAMTRIASGNTTVQHSLGGVIGGSSLTAGTSGGLSTGGSGGGLGGGGGDIIQSYSDADVWKEVTTALDAMIFPATPTTPGATPGAPLTTPAAQTPQVAAGAGAGTPPFTRSSGDGTFLSITPVSGLISVTAPPAKMAEVSDWLKLYEASIRRQVLIEAKIVEVDFADSTQTGINWGVVTTRASNILSSTNNALGLATSSGTCGGILCYNLNGNTQINAVIQALASQGKVTTLSDPRVSTLQNQRATFNVTTDANFFATSQQPIVNPTTGAIISFNTNVTIDQIQVGIVLDVTPQISADGTITMSIRPLVTSLDNTQTFTSASGGAATAPVTSTRGLDAMAIARNGETIMMGGLNQNRVDAEKGGIPGLMDLPGVLGKIFTTRKNVITRSELVVFLTPTIMAGPPPGH